ncbi:17459_t:CDS:1 [Cetraspora pellucida]|uniref:17459_t:CDS:1 n=1 Tax=Cetraspora pellucida TaxID=1433469 RepID=A0A9N9ETT7_9GLOM|nr:17459_t:CDS:1 [Cetraspora pellucida]
MPNEITNLIPSSSLHPDFSITCEDETQTFADRSLVFPPEPVRVPFRVSVRVSKAQIYPWTSVGLDRHTLGSMKHRCRKCRALLWIDERLLNSSTRSPVFTTCYAGGKILLPPLQELPSPLNTLLTRTDQRARLFKQNIKMYNSALSFTSLGANIDHSITGTSGVYSFRIHGKMYHSIGSLFPDDDNRPEFAQLYIYDTEHELRNRMNIMPGLDPVILGELQQMLHDLNPYCNIFKQAGHMLLANPSLNLRMAITDNRKKDPR